MPHPDGNCPPRHKPLLCFSPGQEQAALIKVNDSFKKIIVVSGNTPLWRNEQGITIMNLYEFLLDENSLDL